MNPVKNRVQHIERYCPHVDAKEIPVRQVYAFDYWTLHVCIACDRMLKGNIFDYVLEKMSHPLVELSVAEPVIETEEVIDRDAIDKVSFDNLMHLLSVRLNKKIPNRLASELLHWRNSYVNELTEEK